VFDFLFTYTHTHIKSLYLRMMVPIACEGTLHDVLVCSSITKDYFVFPQRNVQMVSCAWVVSCQDGKDYAALDMTDTLWHETLLSPFPFFVCLLLSLHSG
jgi:hypothetical protein